MLLISMLWAEPDLHKKTDPICWDVVFQPKKAGGTFLRKISLWKRVAVWRHTWAIL